MTPIRNQQACKFTNIDKPFNSIKGNTSTNVLRQVDHNTFRIVHRLNNPFKRIVYFNLKAI